MGIRARTLSVMVAVLATSLAACFCISGLALLASDRANDLEEKTRAAGAAEQWLTTAVQDLAGRARDYARWDDALLFTEGRLPSFATEYLTLESFENLDLDVVLVGTPEDLRLSLARELEEGGAARLVPPSPEFSKVLTPLLGSKAAESGLVEWGGGTWLYARIPVSRSDGTGVNGTMWLVARELTPSRMATPEHLVSGRITLVRAGSSAALEAAPRPLALGAGFDGWNVIAIPDARGARAGRGLTAIAINTAVVGVIALSAAVFLLDRMVLRRLSALSAGVAALREGSAAARLPVNGDDELDRLAVAINELVDADRRMREGAEREARRDPLTGLANRSVLRARLEEARMGAEAGPGATTALLFVDLDQMKRVNDHLGHQAGDAVICEVAKRLAESTGEGDLVARLGGDEFAVVLHGVDDLVEAGERAQAFLALVRRPMVVGGEVLELTASIGVSLCRPGVDSASLMKEADTAMYTAKQAGRSGWSAYDRAMHQKVLGRLPLELALREAVRGGGISVEFQPIVELAGGALAGFEALARWNDPVRGAVSPAEFIPVAE